MSHQAKIEQNNALLSGQKYQYEGYPDWYSTEIAKNEPINIDKFKGDNESAVNFYYKEVNKLFFANTVLSSQLRQALEEKKVLADLIAGLEENQIQSTDEKKKRIRRCANQIQRKYICTVKNCQKSYGTEGSMAQHMRLKHPDVQYNPNWPDIPKKEVGIVKKEDIKRQCKKN